MKKHDDLRNVLILRDELAQEGDLPGADLAQSLAWHLWKRSSSREPSPPGELTAEKGLSAHRLVLDA